MKPSEYQRLADLERDYWWHQGRRAIVGRVLARERIAGPWIVDLGAGTGGNSPVLARFGRVVTIDSEREALRLAGSVASTLPIQADAETLPLASGSAGVVAMLDVIEHVDAEAAVLAECHRVLDANGLLLVTVPAYPWLWSGHDEALGHRRRYLRRDLVRTIEAAGFVVTLCSHIVSCVFPLFVAYRIAERTVRHRQQSSYVPVPRLVNACFAATLRFEGLLATSGIPLPFGTSIIAVARRQENS